ncbi:hypothetical protein [Actinoplanes solisilvae]|uniref:hypothetical protein n=1 Tax=Actinoplanes solisilvae TaxID=2486853 RepID=UPI000FD8C8E9|nr:hypothetical protein [Actinoplanes solisilvae]
MPIVELLRQWTTWRRVTALTVAALAIVAPGLLYALGSGSSCSGPCPAAPVSDRFWFLHRELGPEGSITVRMTAMTGTITYPPPDHDRIVSGLVPWAKAGIIIKDGVRPGSAYAALMMTGAHGVRFQHDYRHDVAGSAEPVSAQSPRWLRLTRSGDTVTGSESADGRHWRTVATAKLDGLPPTVQIGLFATSPGDLTLRKVALGGSIEEVRFTQAVGRFDNVVVEGGTAGTWASDPVGEMNHTDWEKLHHASGAVEKNGVITVSGTGDIGPIGEDGVPYTAEKSLTGVLVALIILLVVAVRDGARTARASGRGIAGRAALVAGIAFVPGLIAVGIVVPVTVAALPMQPMSMPALARVIVGVPGALALCAALAFGLGVLLRRGWVAVVAVLSLIALPYAVTAVPLVPDPVAEWLLRVTPAAGFAVKQTVQEFPQVTAHYAPSAGYFPLPWWAGLAVLAAYTVIVVRLADQANR